MFRVDEAEITNGGCNVAGQNWLLNSVIALSILKSFSLQVQVRICPPMLISHFPKYLSACESTSPT